MGFCEGIAKYLLFGFNFIVVLFSIALIVIGSLALKSGLNVANIPESKIMAPSIAIIVVGCVMFLIAFFGCFGALQEESCMLTTYGILLLTLLVIEIALAVVIFFFRAKFETAFGNEIQILFDKYNEGTKDTVDSIQQTFHCCGVDGPQYWYSWTNVKVPQSCCQHPTDKSCFIDHWQDGCKQILVDDIRKFFTQMGAVAIAIACVQVIGVVFSFCLASSIRTKGLQSYY